MQPSTEPGAVAGMTENLAEVVRQDLAQQEKVFSNRPFEDLQIGISISNSEELEELGFSNQHQKDFTIELARHLMIQGATLLYGGDLRREGFTQVFAELSFMYRIRQGKNHFPFRNYFHFPLHCSLTGTQRLEFYKSKVEIREVPPDPALALDVTQYDMIKMDAEKKRYVIARCLSYMRQQMVADSDCRIFFGGIIGGEKDGSIKSYAGKYPGIVEEAWISMKQHKPVYLLGAFGGATGRIIQALEEKNSQVIEETEAYHQIADYQTFQRYFNEQNAADPIDFKAINEFFKEQTVANLAQLNGLTEAENRRLFVSPHFPECIHLLMKGINTCARRN